MSEQQSTTLAYGFLRLPQVMALIPISKSAWWKGCSTGRYPRPIKLGPRTTVWRAEDIRAFIEKTGREEEQEEPRVGS